VEILKKLSFAAFLLMILCPPGASAHPMFRGWVGLEEIATDFTDDTD
jgi:hypothetical protein